ncbi:MAG: AAA family ATPase [Deltaproteobacteria bacterium]|nr:AAA family ATPase [Deltaproteobacteria bacterium]
MTQGPLPPLIGRDDELADLVALFALGTRVVTVLGPPGVGKTALARHVAARTRGAVFCDLGSARSAGDAADAVAEALGAPLAGVDAEAVGRVLADRRSGLVVLDEADPVLEDLAILVGEWRLAAPDIRFLVTSRARLHLQNEHCVDLHPLDGHHAITPDMAWDLLSDAERRAACQLTVFRGGFDLEAARAVLRGPDAVDLVEALVDHSLVHTSPHGPGPPRYHMREATREYAANQASPWLLDRTRARHAFHYLQVGQRRALDADDPDGGGAIEVLFADRHNTADAFGVLADPRPTDAVALLLSLEPLWDARGASSVDLDRLREAVHRFREDPFLHVRLLTALALALGPADRWQEAVVHAEEALLTGRAMDGLNPEMHAALERLASSLAPDPDAATRREMQLALRLLRLAVRQGDGFESP